MCLIKKHHQVLIFLSCQWHASIVTCWCYCRLIIWIINLHLVCIWASSTKIWWISMLLVAIIDYMTSFTLIGTNFHISSSSFSSKTTIPSTSAKLFCSIYRINHAKSIFISITTLEYGTTYLPLLLHNHGKDFINPR